MPPKPPQKFAKLPTEQEWQQATTITTMWYTHSRKNPDLLAIDAALRGYWVSAKSSRAGETEAARLTRTRIQALNLIDIIKKCKVWIDHKTAGRKMDTSNRADMVKLLSLCAKKELDRLAADVGRLDQFGSKTTVGPAGTKVLSPAAQMGARTRFAMAKTMVVQGPGKKLDREVITEGNRGGVNPRHFEGHSLQHQFANQVPDKTKPQDSMGYKFLFDYVRQADVLCAEIIYLNEDERWHQQFRVEDGKAYRILSPDGSRKELLPSRSTGNLIISTDQHLYFLNKGHFQGKIDERAAAGHKAEFRHSSFMAGEPVLFAGGLAISSSEPGVITDVDSGSGHYRPSFLDFHKGLKVLQANGVDMTRVTAMHMVPTMFDKGDGVMDRIDRFAMFPAATLVSKSATQINAAAEMMREYGKGEATSKRFLPKLKQEFGEFGLT